MNAAHFKKLNLKSKVALSASGLFTLFVIAGSYFAHAYFAKTFKETISTQQFVVASTAADAIDEKLRVAQKALIAVASTAPPDAVTNAAAAQKFLDSNAGLRSIFDSLVTVISLDGKLVAEAPYAAGRRGKDFSCRKWYQSVAADRKPYISAPFVSTHPPHNSVINMTVPIFDTRGRMTGMLTGSLNLLGENFLANLSRARIGKGGYFVITDEERLMIVHPDKQRIMKPAASPGINRMYDRALAGFEGSGETTTSNGIEMLSSFKHLRMTSWVLAANYPAAEAYAPLYRARVLFALGTLAATLVLLLMTWRMMKHLMSQLHAITAHLEQMPEKSGEERLVTVDSSDEIGILAQNFNAMIRSLDGQREELTAQALQLEKEIAERNQAQEALLLKQQLLEVLNNSLEERITATVDDLRQKDRMLIQQSRQAAMGEMFDNIAHQWRQPLNNLGLIVQGLQQSFVLGQLDEEELFKQVDWAMNTIGFMSRTIDDFRNYFSPDKEKVVFNVHPLVLRTISIIEGSLRTQGIAVDIHVTQDPEISGYPNEYAQVLLNILINARDALSEKRTTDPRVVVSMGIESGKAVVVIADNGGGIPEQIIDRIFDPYFTTKNPGKGTGVGLFMSKTIIEKNLGGALTVRNTAEGAEFRVVV